MAVGAVGKVIQVSGPAVDIDDAADELSPAYRVVKIDFALEHAGRRGQDILIAPDPRG